MSKKLRGSGGNPKSAGVVEKDEFEADADVVSAGGLAGLMHVVASVAKVAAKASTLKVPHMLFEHLRWVRQQPPSHPMLPVELSVATDGYKEVGAIVPPATRRRTADF